MELPIEIHMRTASRRPDKEWEKGDPAAPKLRSGKQLLRIYKLIPEKVGAFDAEGDTYGILVKDSARSLLSNEAQRGWGVNQLRGYLAYVNTDVGIPLREIPQIQSVYKSKTGRKIEDYLPSWYEVPLVVKGELPLNSSNIKGVLSEAGWKVPRIFGDSYMQKRFSSEFIVARIPDIWDKDIRLFANPPRRIEKDQMEAFRAATTTEMSDFRGKSYDDLEKICVKLAAEAKKWRPAAEAKTHEDFAWRSLRGPEGLKEWSARVEEEALDYIRYRTERANQDWNRNPLPTTKEVVDSLVENGGPELWTSRVQGVNRREFGQLVSKILKKLNQRKVINKDTNRSGPPRWELWPKD
jgi:hypothetical protein